jgi:hypothetical protein
MSSYSPYLSNELSTLSQKPSWAHIDHRHTVTKTELGSYWPQAQWNRTGLILTAETLSKKQSWAHIDSRHNVTEAELGSYCHKAHCHRIRAQLILTTGTLSQKQSWAHIDSRRTITDVQTCPTTKMLYMNGYCTLVSYTSTIRHTKTF